MYSLFNPGARWGVCGKRLTSVAWPPAMTQYQLYKKLGVSQGRFWTGAENHAPPPGLDPRTVQPVTNRYTD
jgi:hypothetical protein